MYRVIQIVLQTSPEQSLLLEETTKQFTEAFNEVCRVGWEQHESNGVNLHHLTYYPIREKYTQLNADHIIALRMKATEALKSAFKLEKMKKKVSCPHSDRCSPRLNGGTFNIFWETNTVKINTVGGRLSFNFTLPEYFKERTKGKVCTADLIFRNNHWYLNVVIEVGFVPINPCKATIGVDLGICHPAVTSKCKFFGKKSWKNIEKKIFNQRRSCQKKGTHSAKRKLKKIANKKSRFHRDCDHVLSKRIVDSCPVGGTIVLENLKNITKRSKGDPHKFAKRQRRLLHSWSFDQLKSFLEYKAEQKGVRVVLVDPRWTSQTCRKCGHRDKKSRKTQSLFVCTNCGYTLNADLNASWNVRQKHLGLFGKSIQSRSPSTDPID